MKLRSIGISIVATCIVLFTYAQQKHSSKIKYSGKSFMGDKTTQSGTISKAKFDALIAQPLYSSDSAGKIHVATNFEFTYSERAMYQDSNGYPLLTTDYFATNSENGKLSNLWLNTIRDKSKAGDTAYFDKILVIDSSVKPTVFFYTEPIRLIITK